MTDEVKNIELEVTTTISEAFASIDGKIKCPLCEDVVYETNAENEQKLREHLQKVHMVIV
jgi:uncharacterized Zn finger protein (UPF0148 family)